MTMSTAETKIFPLGNGALTVEFGREIEVSLNQKAIALADHLEGHRFEGYIEAVPAYASTTVFFDVVRIRRAFDSEPTAFDAARNIVESALANIGIAASRSRTIEIPVDFGKDSAPDLSEVAERNGLTENEVIQIFLGKDYRVYMIGFLPGFAYMGEVDERIAAPRKDSARLKVPKGSVGIAGRQTGIYPFDSPGGWQIIGRTNMKLFDPRQSEPCLLQAGDAVKFVRSGE